MVLAFDSVALPPRKAENNPASDIPDSDFRNSEWPEWAKSMQEFPNSGFPNVGNSGIGFPNVGNSGIGFPNVGKSGISLPQSKNFRNRLRQIPEMPAPGLKATYILFKRTKVQ